jgi:uncharacterized membrane protein YkoI
MEDNKITSIQFENGLLIFEMEIDGKKEMYVLDAKTLKNIIESQKQ